VKPWGGRFEKDTDKLVEAFTASIPFDKRLAAQDISGSIAHCRMLAKCGIITEEESVSIIEGLKEILEEIRLGTLTFPIESEDIHMRIEKRLIEKIGSTGGKLHTARSRNDQVALDMHMFVKQEIQNSLGLLRKLQRTIIDLSETYIDVLMPGYTHLQRAQPVLFSHHMLAYFWMFQRDAQRLDDTLKRVDNMPLGAGALAGTTFPINRKMVADELGFKAIYANSMDAVSDRDFVVEFMFCASLIMIHLSRLSEDLILWSTSEFGFIEMDDAYTTGSSIMPQKKNPDIAELVRGKSGRTIGNLVGILTVLKGLPMTYNRDMQEDKELLFDTTDTLMASLEVYSDMLGTIKPNRERMRKAVEGDMCTATDLADYLVRKGMPFRDAHAKVGLLVHKCLSEGKSLNHLTENELKEVSALFDKDCLGVLSADECIASRRIEGGTAITKVLEQLTQAKDSLNNRIGGMEFESTTGFDT